MSLTIPIAENFMLKMRSIEDAEAIFEITDTNRPYLREWLPWVDGTKTVEDTRNFLKKCLDNYDNGSAIDLGIWFEGKWVGSIGLNKIDTLNRNAEIGYWLTPEYSGRGLMTQAVQALITYAYTETKLNRLVIMAAIENTKSRAIPERLGFVQEGVCREEGWLYDHFVDLAMYALVKSDWVNKK